MRNVSFLASVVMLIACDSAPAPTAGDKSEKAMPAPANAEAAPSKPQPPTLPPPPEGTVIVDGRYVHTCSGPKDCPALMQAAGAEHCKGLSLGGYAWRLPTIEELESWKGKPELSGFDVFHWSGSAWDEDPGQVWIFDPGSDAKTTAKPDRKPFTIRCVAKPNG